MVLEGLIIKGYGGFYYVWDENAVWECSLRGKLRIKNRNILPGDRVFFSVIDGGKKKAVIEEIKPRETELTRPAVANVEQAVIVMAVKEPEPDFMLLDKLLVLAQYHRVKPLICFNKTDLMRDYCVEEIKKQYEETSFPVLLTSSKEKIGLDGLSRFLARKISVFAGPSGVGKSSLLNTIEPGHALKTGEISEKLERGKHTTRHAELLQLSSGGMIADTPGFSRIYLPPEIKKERLPMFYPEYFKYNGLCRFNTCLHREEPDCAVKKAVEKGILNKERYSRYLDILAGIMAEERRMY